MANLSRISGDATVPANAASRVSWSFGTAELLGNQTAQMYRAATLSLLTGDDLSANTSALNAYLTVKGVARLLGSDVPTTAIPSISLDMGILAAVYRAAGWDGTLTILLEWEGGSDLTLSTLTGGIALTGDTPIDSGMPGNESAHSRVDRCPKTGQRMVRERMVQDGWHEGTRVAPDAFDPEDPLRHRPAPRSEPPLGEDG